MAQLQSVLMLVGRILVGIPFLVTGIMMIPFWGSISAVIKQYNLPMPAIFLVVAIVFCILGGISLIAGFKARIGSIILMIVVIAATLAINDLWSPHDDVSVPTIGTLWNNLALFGGLLYVLTFGPGGISLDMRKKRD